MLNLAYTGLVLFGKFLYLSFCNFYILVHVLKFCENVIFVPALKASLECVLRCSAFSSLC